MFLVRLFYGEVPTAPLVPLALMVVINSQVPLLNNLLNRDGMFWQACCIVQG